MTNPDKQMINMRKTDKFYSPIQKLFFVTF